MLDKKRCRFVNTTKVQTDCFNCFQLNSWDNNCQELQFYFEDSKSLLPKFCQLTWKNVFHYFGVHYVTCPQPLEVPCACGTFKKPVSRIASVGSLVNYLIPSLVQDRSYTGYVNPIWPLRVFAKYLKNG